MMLNLFGTLGVLSVDCGSQTCGHRSVIVVTACSSLVHAPVMGCQGMRYMIARGELIGVAVLVVIGVTLLALAPAMQAPMNQVGA
ncbi:MAG: hypothetical protein WA700_05800 [Acidobacteriaceae bacterium]